MNASRSPHTTDPEGASRRSFLRAAAVSGVASALGPRLSLVAQTTTAANDQIGVGFIGTGGRGGFHLSVVHELAEDPQVGVEIVAVCDAYRPRAQRASSKHGGKVYSDYRDLLNDPRVDAVCIATPDHHHCRQAIDAIQAGKDVYCEKPLSHWRQFEITKELLKVVQASDRVFQLGTQGMSDDAWHKMAKLVDEGWIGKPIHAECGYFRVGDGGERGMPIDDPNAKPGADLNWDAFLGDSPKRPFDVSRFFRWRMYEDYSGGQATDLFPHSLTPIVHAVRVGMPHIVVATGGIFRYPEREVPDTCNLLIDYPEKVTIACLGTQGNSYPGRGGHRGSGHRTPVIRGWDGSLVVSENEIVFVPVHGSEKKTRTVAIEHGENTPLYWRKFLAACRLREKQTLSPIDLAYRVQTALIMAIQSQRQGKVARFNAESETIVL